MFIIGNTRKGAAPGAALSAPSVEDRVIRNLNLGQISGNLHFDAGTAITAVTSEGLGLDKMSPDYLPLFMRHGERTEKVRSGLRYYPLLG